MTPRQLWGVLRENSLDSSLRIRSSNPGFETNPFASLRLLSRNLERRKPEKQLPRAASPWPLVSRALRKGS